MNSKVKVVILQNGNAKDLLIAMDTFKKLFTYTKN